MSTSMDEAERIERLIAAVDWGAVHDAYGPATKVPGLLRAIAAGEDAWFDVWSHVVHQGTVYEATLHAIPVLVAIAEWHGHPSRADAIEMLAAIATADDVGGTAASARSAAGRLLPRWRVCSASASGRCCATRPRPSSARSSGRSSWSR